jgi:hypothetical protein
MTIQEAEAVDVNNLRSQAKTQEVWQGLREWAQPIVTTTLVGMLIKEMQSWQSLREDVVAAISLPLVFLAVASIVNSRQRDVDLMFRNYLYYPSMGVLAMLAMASTPYLEFFFQMLHENWFKNVFNTTMLHPTLGLGFRTMAAWHTLYHIFQPRIYDFIFVRNYQ